MKKVKATLDILTADINRHWNRFNLKKQQRYTLCGFVAYTMLTIGVVVKVCIDAGSSDKKLSIEHIKNPTIDKATWDVKVADSLLFILKKH